MKTFLKILVIALFLSAGSLNAQKVLKIGNINSQELFAIMPEKIEADKQLVVQNTTLVTQLETMQVEFNKKYEEYLAQQDTLQALIRQTKEEDLNVLNQRIATFRDTAQKDLETKEAELYNPIIEKARNAIKEVAVAENYDYVFDTGAGNVIHFPEGDNLLELVKTKLGIQ